MGNSSPKKAPETDGLDPASVVPSHAFFTKMYQQHVSLVWRVLRKTGIRDHETIDDLAQEVFTKAYRKWDTYDPSLGSERTWLAVIAVGEARNHLRRGCEERMESDEEPSLESAENIEKRLSDAERVRLFLESTTPERRQVFELYELEGFTIPEIARILRIHEEAAAKRLRLAREDIQAAAKRLHARENHELASSGIYYLPLFDKGLWREMDASLMAMPDGSEARIWKRICTELGLPASPPQASTPLPAPASPPQAPVPIPAPARPPTGLKALVRHMARAVKNPWSHIGTVIVSSIVSAAIVHATTPAIPSMPVPSSTPIALNAATAQAESAAPEPSASSVALPIIPSASAAQRRSDDARGSEAEELHLLLRAQAAYASGEKKRALEALDEYDRRFQPGQLRGRWQRLQQLIRSDQEP